MNIENLEFVSEHQPPFWFSNLEHDGKNYDLFISAGAEGPSDEQISNLTDFLEQKNEYLEMAKELVMGDDSDHKFIHPSFILGAVTVLPEEDNFQVSINGIVKKKKFIGSSKHYWSYYLDDGNICDHSISEKAV